MVYSGGRKSVTKLPYTDSAHQFSDQSQRRTMIWLTNQIQVQRLFWFSAKFVIFLGQKIENPGLAMNQVYKLSLFVQCAGMRYYQSTKLCIHVSDFVVKQTFEISKKFSKTNVMSQGASETWWLHFHQFKLFRIMQKQCRFKSAEEIRHRSNF